MPKKENILRKKKNKLNALKMMIHKLNAINMMLGKNLHRLRNVQVFHVQAGVRL